jgi:hypothetical protein
MSISIRGALALSVQFMGALLAVRAGEPASEAPAHIEATHTESAEARAVCHARAHPSYQVFAAHLRLPAITALDDSTLSIGGQLRFDFRKVDDTVAQEKVAVAKLLEIPDTAFTGLTRTLPADGRLSPEELARQFQTAVMDYKYLSNRWEQYRPGPEGEPVKTEALKSLRTGDLGKAWQLFIGLPRPSAPTGFRIASPQASAGQ